MERAVGAWAGHCPPGRGSQSRPDPRHPAGVAPGKRPRLTPNPAILVTDKGGIMPFGTPGGDVQIQAMLQVLLNVMHFGMDPQSAIEAPRVASYSFPSCLRHSSIFPAGWRWRGGLTNDAQRTGGTRTPSSGLAGLDVAGRIGGSNSHRSRDGDDGCCRGPPPASLRHRDLTRPRTLPARPARVRLPVRVETGEGMRNAADVGDRFFHQIRRRGGREMQVDGVRQSAKTSLDFRRERVIGATGGEDPHGIVGDLGAHPVPLSLNRHTVQLCAEIFQPMQRQDGQIGAGGTVKTDPPPTFSISATTVASSGPVQTKPPP